MPRAKSGKGTPVGYLEDDFDPFEGDSDAKPQKIKRKKSEGNKGTKSGGTCCPGHSANSATTNRPAGSPHEAPPVPMNPPEPPAAPMNPVVAPDADAFTASPASPVAGANVTIYRSMVCEVANIHHVSVR